MFRSVAADQSPVNFRPGKLAADIAQVDVKGFCLLNREKGLIADARSRRSACSRC